MEDHLRAPYGVYADRGSRIAADMPRWGHAVFDSLFGAGPVGDALIALRSSGRPVEVVLRSDHPGGWACRGSFA